jgi:ribosomal protein S6
MPEGYYVVATFKSAPEFPSELDRLFNIDETIMRSMIIRLEYDAAEKKAAKIAADAAAAAAAEAVVEEPATEAPADAE